MLTSEHAIVVYDQNRAFPDRLTRRRHGQYRDYARRMLDIYRAGLGRTRRELHQAVEKVLSDEAECESRRIQAFCKLLDDEGTFETDPHGKASELRLKVFALAAPYHPLVQQPDQLFESSEAQVKEMIAHRMGRPWEEIEDELFADVMDYQRLRSFEGYPDPEALLSRYNVAQVQACLYRCDHMTVTAGEDFTTILRYAKLSKLMLELKSLEPSVYSIDLSGPATVLRESRRYGICFARFVPALLACRDWTMQALVQTNWGGKVTLTLTSKDGLRSHLPSPEGFDSEVERSFATRFGAERDGWRMVREGVILHREQTTFVPDFVFRHDDGTEVLFEIVGFWTPEYLARKAEILRLFASHRVLLALPLRSLREGAQVPDNVILYKTRLKVEPVLEALERARA